MLKDNVKLADGAGSLDRALTAARRVSEHYVKANLILKHMLCFPDAEV